MFRRFAEAGVTDFVCAPWMFVRVEPDTPDDKALADRLAAGGAAGPEDGAALLAQLLDLVGAASAVQAAR